MNILAYLQMDCGLHVDFIYVSDKSFHIYASPFTANLESISLFVHRKED